MSDFVPYNDETPAEPLILSVRETEAFVDAILNPAEPGPTLLAAAQRYKICIVE